MQGPNTLVGSCFEQTFDLEWNRAYRAQTPLSLLLVDVDHFKSINDCYGHPYGDTVLRQVATAIQATLPRSGDLVARYGREEFAVILQLLPTKLPPSLG
jgi:diguanylate cyclase (GGDEF)-like protein